MTIPMPAPAAVNPFAHRCEVISDAVGMPRAVGGQFIDQLLTTSNFGEAASSDDRTDQTVVYLVSMAYLGRSATPEEAARISHLLATESPTVIDHSLQSWPACRQIPARNQLVPTDPACTYVDVTHTLFLRRNSGIQRVVRQLAKALAASNHRHAFVRFDERLCGYRPLTEPERARLLDWERFSCFDNKLLLTNQQKTGLKAWLKKAGRSRFGQPVRRVFRTLRDHSREIRRRLKRGLFSQPEPGVCQFFWEGRLLLPEVIAATGQLSSLAPILAAAPLRSTMVFYDLLPISHPECFVSSTVAGFVEYLTLMRHIDQISCISETVRNQLQPLLSTMPRIKPNARSQAHLLAGDFRPTATAVTDESLSSPEPIVLCVGTIEPRKNQTRILRAMVTAQQAGQRFRGIFVGNAGWLNGQFRHELRKARSCGIQVELHEGISDDALAALYRTASLTVYCSVAEGFGLPIVESVMAGVPCLTSNLGSMQEIAEQIGGCSLVNPYSTGSIAAALTRLLGHQNELARLTGEAQQARWHSWSDYCEQLMTFVEADATEQPTSADQSLAHAS